jgi:DNA-binding YbaB/EbfC family protein
MLDMMKMLGKVKEVQAKVKEAQENLVKLNVDGEAGGGLVIATVNGARQIINLQIDESLFGPEDQIMLKDLVIAATNKALAEMEILIKEEMKKTTEGIMPNIPGLDLSGLM